MTKSAEDLKTDLLWKVMFQTIPNKFSVSRVTLGSEFSNKRDYEKTRKILLDIIKEEGGFKVSEHYDSYWDVNEIKNRTTERVYVCTNLKNPIAARVREETMDDGTENYYLKLNLTSNREIPDEFTERIISSTKLNYLE